MLLRLLNRDDRPMVEKLLRENPFKEEQVRFQGLAPEKMVKFHADRIFAQSIHPDSPVWIYEVGGRVSLWGIAPSPTHSSFFGISIFSIEPVISYDLRQQEKLNILREIGDVLETKGARLVWSKCNERETDLPRCYTHVGAEYTGTAIRMSRKLDGSEGGRESRVRHRTAEPEDLHPLMEMARQSHHFSHFFRDPYLPKEAKREIFSAYLARSFGQENRPILVAEDEQGGLTGFSLLLCPAKQEERIGQTVGIVDFVVVKEETKGQGIGGQLLTASFVELMARGYRYVELKTMLENIPALNFYQRHGLRILSAEMHFSFGGGASRWH